MIVFPVAIEYEVPAEALAEAEAAAKAAVRDFLLKHGGVRPTGLRVLLDGPEVVVEFDVPPAEIFRIRRITGYLSNAANWQASKLAELKDRTAHG